MPYVTKYRNVTKEGTREVTEERYRTDTANLGYEEIPLHRPKIIYFEFQGLRPNIPHWIFFDGVQVTNYCNTSKTLSDITNAASDSPYREPGDQFINETGFPTDLGGPTGTPLYSDANGELSGLFYLQSNSTLNFNTSVDGLNFVAIDISVLDRDEALSYGAVKFYGVGQNQLWYEYQVAYDYTFTETYTYTEKEKYKVYVPPAPAANNGDDGGPTISVKTTKIGGQNNSGTLTQVSFEYDYGTVTHYH